MSAEVLTGISGLVDARVWLLGATARGRVPVDRVRAAIEITTVWLNGAPAGRVEIDGQLAAVSLVVEDGRVTRIYAIANRHKLTRLDEPAELAR